MFRRNFCIGVRVNTASQPRTISSLSAVMMEAVITSETSVSLYQPTRHGISEDSHLNVIFIFLAPMCIKA
jgi:hypothetical protein